MSKKPSSKGLRAFPTFHCTFLDGLQINICVERKNESTVVATLELQRDGRPVTELEDKLWRALLVPPFLYLLRDLAKATAQEKLAADFTNLAKDYEKVIYKGLRSSKEREAYTFLLRWRREKLLAAANGRTISCSDQIKSLQPVLDALDKVDGDFFQSLAKAVKTLSDRISLSKDKVIGEQLHRWLLEYKLRRSGKAEHTARELNEQFVSNFRSISDKKLREICGKLEVPLRQDKRGKAAVRYGLNGPNVQKKGLITSD